MQYKVDTYFKDKIHFILYMKSVKKISISSEVYLTYK